MHKSLFMRIVGDLSEVSPFFQQRPDCTGTLGFSPIQKVTAAFRMLAYGTNPDALDESISVAPQNFQPKIHSNLKT